jgi:hypothetical protein
MDRKLTIRLIFTAVMLLTACLVSCGCRSAGSPSGLMGVSSLVDPVPPQWEPEVKTLSPSQNEETSSAE